MLKKSTRDLFLLDPLVCKVWRHLTFCDPICAWSEDGVLFRRSQRECSLTRTLDLEKVVLGPRQAKSCSQSNARSPMHLLTAPKRVPRTPKGGPPFATFDIDLKRCAWKIGHAKIVNIILNDRWPYRKFITYHLSI
jgi:hypothetical protein